MNYIGKKLTKNKNDSDIWSMYTDILFLVNFFPMWWFSGLDPCTTSHTKKYIHFISRTHTFIYISYIIFISIKKIFMKKKRGRDRRGNELHREKVN